MPAWAVTACTVPGLGLGLGLGPGGSPAPSGTALRSRVAVAGPNRRSVLTPCSPSARLSARPRLIPLPAHARRAFWACRCFGFAWNLASSQPVDMPAFDAALDRLPK